MNEPWVDRWNERYSSAEFAYGEEPNNYLKEQLEKLKPGTLLFPAEGEGRNAVFAAKLGWAVSAFDISEEGKNKALRLATANNVTIDYQVGELQSLNYHTEQFDAIALIIPTSRQVLNHYTTKHLTTIYERMV
ncbi:MAG: class I SAM-dependent methyltransferase [Chitinophagaceae bacterium]